MDPILVIAILLVAKIGNFFPTFLVKATRTYQATVQGWLQF